MKSNILKRIRGKVNLILARIVAERIHGPEFPDQGFIELAYRLILDRRPDPVGLPFYIGKISEGAMSRRDFVAGLVGSDEFSDIHDLLPIHAFFTDVIAAGSPEKFAPFVKTPPLEAVQLNRLASASPWLDSDWRQFAEDLQVVPLTVQSMHRKAFEWVQAIYGLNVLGKIRDDVTALGVGTGHECIVYWLAKKLRRVVATDLFAGEWTFKGSREGDPSVLNHPEKYQPFPYPKERLTFWPMDGRALALKNGSFDVVFSLSSLEHFGDKKSAALAMQEMARVLKPGGIAVIATEYILNQTEHAEFFNERDLLEHVVKSTEMKLIQNISFDVPRILLERPLDSSSEIYKTPHMSLKAGEVVWTSIILFFEKAESVTV
ncbi:MAG: methyltransferase domain-containing protein [Desulfobacterales bacterium]|nr:MAG: methyltransferase domain-containing protein [Desulfobacterales bacterium]